MGCFANTQELQILAAILKDLAGERAAGVGVYVGNANRLDSLREAADDLELSLDFDTGLDRASRDATPMARLAGVAEALEPQISRESPRLLLVQGSSAGAAGAAVAGAASGATIAHLTREATTGIAPPAFRALMSRLASFHCSSDASWLAAARANGVPFGHTLQLAEDPTRSASQVAAALLGFLARPAQPLIGSDAALEDFVSHALKGVEEIAPEAALAILETPGQAGWHFLDVREADEYAESHLPGARNSPRGFLEVRADLSHYKRDPWLADRRRKLILYCGGGHRSALAARTLVEMGFQAVRSLSEGYTGWLERGYPVEPGSA